MDGQSDGEPAGRGDLGRFEPSRVGERQGVVDTEFVAGEPLHGVGGEVDLVLAVDVGGTDGAELLVRTMDDLATGHATFTPQEGEATYAPKISKDDARIDWTAPAERIDRAIRAYTPGPGAWTTLGGDRVKVGPVTVDPEAGALAPGQVAVSKDSVHVGTGTAAVRLDRIQPLGKKMMAAADWARGLQDKEGVVFE